MSDRETNEPTVDLVRQVVDGDREAGETLFERYLPIIRQIVALRIGRSVSGFLEHEDIVQDALAKAFASLGQFEPRSEGALRRWLTRIVENQVRDAMRRNVAAKRGGQRAVVQLHTSLLSESVFRGRDPTPTQVASGKEAEQRLEAALLELDERDRHVIVMRRLEGRDYSDIVQELGMASEAAARTVFARALSRLAERLA